MAPEKNDHDLLIEIATKIDFFSKTLMSHITDTAAKMVLAEQKITSAHKRLDTFFLSGILVVVLFIGSLSFHFMK